MKKRLLALIMAALMILTGPVSQIHANVQIQEDSVSVEEVYYVLGEDINTGEPIIKPTMTVSWEDPSEWATNTDPAQIHSPDYYNVVVYNRTKGSTNTIRINKGSPEFTSKTLKVHDRINLDPGSLYDVEVRPYHSHLNADGTTYTQAISSGTPPKAYAITDLNVKFVATESSIQVIWDDIGFEDFEYRIVYAIGDYTNKSKQELLDNKEGEVTKIKSTSDKVTKFYDPEERRNKLAYTITEGIYPGQVYSVMVEPTVDTYNAQPLMRNRNFPVIRSCSTNVQLDIFEEGDYLRLEWEIPPSFQVSQDQGDYELVEATLMQFNDGQSSNIAIFDANAANIGYYKILKPSKETQYQIKFKYLAVDDNTKPAIEPISNMATFVPSELRITPTKPVVPALLTPEILDDLRASGTYAQVIDALENQYFLPGYTYTDNLNKLLSQNSTYHIIGDSQGVNFVWSAFKRIDVDKTSPTYGQIINDDNVYYDIWVTESVDAFAYATKVIDDQRYGTTAPSKNITVGANVCGYSETLTSYYNNTSGTLAPLLPGKLYYIKVVAKKKTSTGELISEPTVVSLYYGYNGDAFEPPTISKPPLEVKEQDDVSVTLTWEEDWWEVISSNPAIDARLAVLENWCHEVWVDATGKVYDQEPSVLAEHFPIYQGEDEVANFLDYLEEVGLDAASINTVSSREIDLGKDAYGASDVKYKFFRKPYATVLSEIEAKKKLDPTYNFDTYYAEMIAEDKNGDAPIAWKNISPSVDPANAEKLLYKEPGLLPNTSYLFMVYPYRQLANGEILYAHYPTPIVVSTNPEDVVVNPDPTVPNLYISKYADTNITVTWKYNKDFQYELVYSQFEDVTTAKPVAWTLPTSITDPLYPVNGRFYEVTVKDLFPNTEYYFWIRAKQPATNVTSHWSNPVLGKTSDVANPLPPRGFGIASLESMKKYNYKEAVTNDYITVEWLLDPLDVPPLANSVVTKNYAYIVEVSDNSNFIDPVYIISSGGVNDVKPDNVEILQKNLIKINELVPNRRYYIRVKTRVTVTGKEQGQLIVKDSLFYSPTIKIITTSTSDEYDGTIDPDLEILPSEDYEIIYDKDTNVLEFRFRDNSEDSEGNMDNNVDQRLISNLISQNTYIYTVDISAYKDKTISKRKVTIPYSIIEAFDTYKVDLKINAGDIKLEMPYGTMTSEVKQQVNQYGGSPTISIEIKPLGVNYVKEQFTGQTVRSVTEAQDVDIYVKSSKKEKALDFIDKEMNVQLATTNKFEAFRVNRLGAIKDSQNNWSTVDSTFDSSSGYMSFMTTKVGTYGGYVLDGSNTVPTNTAHWSEAYRKLVTSEYTIKGMDYYNPNNTITEARLINILYGIIDESEQIDVNGYISKEMMTALKNSKVKNNDSTTNSKVTREEAISMFVRAYEIVNGTLITPLSAQTTAANNNANISSTYKVNMAKAATIGMVSSINQSRPKDALTYGELFALWSKLLH